MKKDIISLLDLEKEDFDNLDGLDGEIVEGGEEVKRQPVIL